MIQALNTAAVGMKGQQQALDTVANNIANIETTGFKRDRVNFKDALYVAMQDASNADSTANLQKGTGGLAGSVSKVFTISHFDETSAPLDVALATENAFFTVEGVGGEIKYTRDGNFKLSVEDDGVYIVNNSGEYILDNNSNRIALPQNVTESSVRIGTDGSLADADERVFARLGVVSFQNMSGLAKLGSNNYAQTANSGAATPTGDFEVRQGYLESSNVQLGDEITNMIKAQRAYQLSSRVLKLADEMEGMANQLRK